MTMLTILRHAKSSWDDAALDDFDRPLNERGRKAARRMGQELQQRGVRFDRVIASPALRVRETLDGLSDGYGEGFEVTFDPQIYGASVRSILRLIRNIPANVQAPLLVGHNPVLQQLVLELTQDDAEGLRARVARKLPTAAVAMIELLVVRWDEVAPHSGRIRELIFPRELD